MVAGLLLIINHLRSTDYVLILALSCCYPVARWLLENTVFKWLSHACLVPTGHQQGKLPDKLSKRVRKLNEAFWKLSCYSLFVLLSCSALLSRSQGWVRAWDTRQFWVGWPNQEGTSALRWVCLIEIAYYVSGTGMLALWEVSRKDQNMMMLHHVLAIVIVGACIACNYTRSCCVAMLLHDINDVLMEMAKISSYNQLEMLANTLFAVFMLAWVALRMVAYPTLIIRSTLFEIVEVIGPSPPCYWVINVPILLLYCIHVYWLYLIVRIALQLMYTGKGEDVREQEDD